MLQPLNAFSRSRSAVCGRNGHLHHIVRPSTPRQVRARRASCRASAAPSGPSSPSTSSARSSLTEEIFSAVDALQKTQTAGGAQAAGAGGRTTFSAFLAADELWHRLRNQPEGAAAGSEPQFVVNTTQPLSAPPQYDVVVCGGTLGIFAAAALARRGLRVAVLERGPLRGRAQEWNISRKELLELEHLGVATREELEACVAIEFNPVRIGFAWQPDGGAAASSSPPSPPPLTEVWTRDVLNLGVRPDGLVQLMRSKLEALGGAVLEQTALEGITVHPDGASLALRPDGGAAATATAAALPSTLTARLVVDCMGHFSPIVRQVRWGNKPDGVCLVVGACGSGFTNNSTADVILTNTPLQPSDAAFNRAQYFWEAFPAATGPTDRTTYMFTYIDAASYRKSLAAMMDDYWKLMPLYQGVRLEDITFKRVLFGFFPTFKDTPLRPSFDRVIQIGDASGLQSPLSFGGFGALTRHLSRLTNALTEAVEAEALDRNSLSLVAAYNPGLSSSWMMQKAMSVREGDRPPPDLINRMLVRAGVGGRGAGQRHRGTNVRLAWQHQTSQQAGNFRAMEKLGDPTMKPFLQDVIQFGPMLRTMGAQCLTDPLSIPSLIAHVGPGPLAEWLGHMANLGAYTALHGAASAARLRATLAAPSATSLPPRMRFSLNRLLDAWEFGSGQDYKL